MSRFTPADIDELRDAVAEALAAEEPLELVGGGSKRGLGRPVQAAHTLDLARLSGIRDYAPNELVLTAGAATPLAEIERVLAEHGQMLAFEPPGWCGLLGADEASPTLGGVLACNLAGPRRIKAGAARDHFLGFRAVSGRGEIFKAGGKVVKNVTGYDLPKLMAGSYGTLTALEEVTVKVLPRPENVVTVLFAGVAPLSGLGERAVWRISIAPARGAAIGAALARALDAIWYLDWGGGLLWLAVAEQNDGGAQAIRAAIRGNDGHGTGYATLVKGSPALRRAVPVFEPQPAALAALSRRVKDAFDPRHILNPGRMIEGS